MGTPIDIWRGAVRRVTPLLRVGPRTTTWVLRSTASAMERNAPSPPPARLTPSLVAAAALDETMSALFVGNARIADDDELRRAAADVDAVHRHWDARGWLAEPRRYHRAPPPPRPTDVSVQPAGFGRGRYELVRFPSDFRPRRDEPALDSWGTENADAVHAGMLRHGDGRDRPWVIVVHGYGMGIPRLDLVVLRGHHLHRHHGLNVIAPVMPRHGPRRNGHRDGLLSHDAVQNVRCLTQAVSDIRRTIAWIRSFSDAPIALGGVSLGGYLTGIVAGLDEVDVAVAGIPSTDLAAIAKAQAQRHLLRRSIATGSVGERADELMRTVSPLALAPRPPRERLFIFAGTGDRMATPQQAHDLWEHWDRPTIEWFPSSHVGFMWSRGVRRFVDRALAESGLSRAAEPATPLDLDGDVAAAAGS